VICFSIKHSFASTVSLHMAILLVETCRNSNNLHVQPVDVQLLGNKLFLQALHFFGIQFKLEQNTKNSKAFSTKCMNWWTLTMQQSLCVNSVWSIQSQIFMTSYLMKLKEDCHTCIEFHNISLQEICNLITFSPLLGYTAEGKPWETCMKILGFQWGV
jgi:hypothetical protein